MLQIYLGPFQANMAALKKPNPALLATASVVVLIGLHSHTTQEVELIWYSLVVGANLLAY